MSGKEVGYGLSSLSRTMASQEVTAPVSWEEDIARTLQLGQQSKGWFDIVYRLKATHRMIEVIEQRKRPGLDAAIFWLSKRGKEGITLTS